MLSAVLSTPDDLLHRNIRFVPAAGEKVEASDLSPIKRHLGSNTFTFHLSEAVIYRSETVAFLVGAGGIEQSDSFSGI
jgi:hypothetical protein